MTHPNDPSEAPAGTSIRALADDAPPAPSSSSLPGHEVHVILEGGHDYVVRVDNRDFIRWDKTAPRQKWNAQEQPFLFQTFLAWAASRRQERTALDFDAFQAACLSAKDVPAEDVEPADPTR